MKKRERGIKKRGVASGKKETEREDGGRKESEIHCDHRSSDRKVSGSSPGGSDRRVFFFHCQLSVLILISVAVPLQLPQ